MIEQPQGVSRQLSKPGEFLAFLKQELEICGQFLNQREVMTLRRYYHHIITANKSRLQYYRNIYQEETSALVSSVGLGTKILDAGCGLGSESILAGLLGAKVIAVDLLQERLDIANKRLRFYQDQLSNAVDINFLAGTVFDLTGDFDVIYAKDAISHIHPLERFVKFAYDHINKNGKLIIVDGTESLRLFEN